VPVLAAGVTAERLPWYTMPYVRGESLRARLAQGSVPLAEAIAILRDVATALDYAHGQRLVHRDIKPENVLLSGRTAVVTDFGIAKALQASRTQAPGRAARRARTGALTGALTQLGTSLGTPAYMAPEQAVGDAVDARADLYAWGVVAYELLAGRHPFAGKTSSQQLIAAHLAEAPAPLATAAPGVPAPLAALVMRTLAKDPADRPSSAADVLAALDAAARRPGRRPLRGPARAPAPAPRPALGARALGAAGCSRPRSGLRALGVGPFGTLFAAGTLRPDDALVVADLASPGDSTLGRAIAQGVKADLAQSRVVRVLEDARVADVLRRMGRGADDRLPLAAAREVAQRAGARMVVDGTVAPLGTGFLVTLRLVTPDSGREVASERASVDTPGELIPAVGTLTRRLRGRIGEALGAVRATPRLEDATTRSLDALRVYTAAYHANGAEDRLGAAALARQAVALDSNFALAWVVLGEALDELVPGTPAVDSATARAYALRERLGAREQLVVTANYFSPGPGRDRARAIAAFDSLFVLGDRQNTNSLGELLASRRDVARAEALAHTRLRVDPDYSVTYANLVVFQLQAGRVAAAESSLARAAARFPAVVLRDGYLPALVRYARGDVAGAAATLERALRDPRVAPNSYAVYLAMLADVATVRGSLARADRLLGALAARRGAGGDAEAAADTARAVVRDAALLGPAPRHAARLDRALASARFTALPPAYRAYLPVAGAYARAGRPDRARAVLARYRAEVADTARRRADAPALHDVLGEVALAERRPAEAAAEFRRGDVAPDGPATACAACLSANLARAFDAAGQADSAAAAMEHYLATPGAARRTAADGTYQDGLYRAAFLRRLGALYATRGDTARAVDRTRAFVALWRDADPALQPAVAEARRRLAALGARP
jgi:serine/threonine-protein kinase